MSQVAPVPRILLVEDDAAIREALDEVLADLGYEVVSAPDGRGGLQLAAQQAEPCPILLDWRMPVLDGPEFLARLVLRPGCTDRCDGRSTCCDAQPRRCAARRATRHASAAHSSGAPSRVGLDRLAGLTAPLSEH